MQICKRIPIQSAVNAISAELLHFNIGCNYDLKQIKSDDMCKYF